MDNGYVSVAEAARILNRSKRTIFRWARLGHLHRQRHPLNGRVTVFRRLEVERLLAALPEA